MAENKFGFSLMKSREVQLSGAWDSSVASIAEREPSIRRCISCGNCAATCSTGGKASVCKAILHVRRGMLDEARADLSGCLFCGKCRFGCPMGVNTGGVIAQLMLG